MHASLLGVDGVYHLSSCSLWASWTPETQRLSTLGFLMRAIIAGENSQYCRIVSRGIEIEITSTQQFSHN